MWNCDPEVQRRRTEPLPCGPFPGGRMMEKGSLIHSTAPPSRRSFAAARRHLPSPCPLWKCVWKEGRSRRGRAETAGAGVFFFQHNVRTVERRCRECDLTIVPSKVRKGPHRLSHEAGGFGGAGGRSGIVAIAEKDALSVFLLHSVLARERQRERTTTDRPTDSRCLVCGRCRHPLRRRQPLVLSGKRKSKNRKVSVDHSVELWSHPSPPLPRSRWAGERASQVRPSVR